MSSYNSSGPKRNCIFAYNMKTRISILLWFFLFLLSGTSQGQRWKFWKKKHFPTYDSTYVCKLPKNLTVEFNNITDFNQIRVQNKKNLRRSLPYRPATPVDIGLKVDYSWLGISLGLTHFNRDQDLYGKTRKFDLTLNIYGRWLVTDLIYRRYKGFYTSISDSASGAHPIYPGLTQTFFNLNMLYLFNSMKYSSKAAFTQNEIQLKSGGSPLFGFYLAYHNIFAPEIPIPDTLLNTFQTAKRFNLSQISIMGFQIGYAHTFVIRKNIKFGFLLNPVFGFQIFHMGNTLNKDRYWGVEGIVKWNYRASLIYDKKWFYCGAMFLKDNSFIGQSKKSFTDYFRIQSGFFKVFAGFRLYRTPKFER